MEGNAHPARAWHGRVTGVAREAASSEVSVIIGPPNSGKSSRVESSLLPWSHKVYVATLPDEPRFRETIDRHVQRRGPYWQSIVCSGSLATDLDRIRAALRARPVPRACMIDGLSNWLAQVTCDGEEALDAAANLADGIARLVYDVPARWCLVDITLDERDDDLGTAMVTASRLLQRRLLAALRLTETIEGTWQNSCT